MRGIAGVIVRLPGLGQSRRACLVHRGLKAVQAAETWWYRMDSFKGALLICLMGHITHRPAVMCLLRTTTPWESRSVATTITRRDIGCIAAAF